VAERRPAARTAGFSLVEVLVALAVLAAGLLGAAALAVDTVQAQHRGMLRAQAQRLAADFAERLRGNRAGLLAYREEPARFGCISGATPGERCTPEELAREELADWRDDIARMLPGGRGEVTLSAGAPPLAYEISLRWRWRDRDERHTLAGWL
jgi:type IV pilus assembly protein PilV